MHMTGEQAYLDIMRDIRDNGVERGDRTGTGTRSVFGRMMRFDLAEGFPLYTTKKVFLRGTKVELAWFLQGRTNIDYLLERDVHFWDQWADENGDLGPVYGKQWRSWPTPDGGTIDQLGDIVERIKAKPECRRLVVSAWNVGDLDSMALHPCHCLFQFYVANGRLSCQLFQRSADWCIGVPVNAAGYALLTHLVAHECGLEPGEFIHTFGDAHIYLDQLEQAETQLARTPGPLPTLRINPDLGSVFDFKAEDAWVEGYDPAPAIKYPVAV